ncbi:hypothetical protein PENSPDRAFT_605738 [Peniophora sp. CONT]|nr:hypothetical protein PENSPDRAFT_605738 [Peniophora sp. CONT]
MSESGPSKPPPAKKRKLGDLADSGSGTLRAEHGRSPTARLMTGEGSSNVGTSVSVRRRVLKPKATTLAEEPVVDAPEGTSEAQPLENLEKESRYIPMHKRTDEFLETTAPLYLDILYEADAPPATRTECSACHGAFPNECLYRCRECLPAGAARVPYCAQCMCDLHGRNPLHLIEKWAPDKLSGTKCLLLDLGLVIRLGHSDSTPCNVGEAVPPVVSTITVVHSTGVQRCKFQYCNCIDPSRNKIHADPHDHQLLRAGFWPATTKQPATVFTLALMREFFHLTMQSQVNARDFIFSKCRMTNNAFKDQVDDRYREFLLSFRQYAFLRMLRWAGVAVPAQAGETGKKMVLSPASIAVLCPACPHPGINMAEKWQDAPKEDVPLHSLFFGKDGNFQQRHHNKKMDKLDRPYTQGGAYYADEDDYQAYLEVVGKRPDAVKETHTCNRFKAITSKYDRLLMSGIVSLSCIRHEHVLPNGTVDLTHGENYASVDYATVCALRLWMALLRIYESYDVECIYGINFFARMLEFPGAPPKEDWPHIMRAIPKGHEPGHKPDCIAEYSFHWLPGSGMTDGEAPERRWAVQNAIAFSARAMGPGYRHDLLNMHNGDFNIQKTFNIGATLVNRLEKALASVEIFSKSLTEMEISLEKKVRPVLLWRQQEFEWLEYISSARKETKGKKRQLKSPYEPAADEAPSLKKVLQSFGAEDDSDLEDNREDDSNGPGDSAPPTIEDLLRLAFEVEDQQERLRNKVEAAGEEPSESDSDVIDGFRESLDALLAKWQALHAIIIQPVVAQLSPELPLPVHNVLPRPVTLQVEQLSELRILPLPSTYPLHVRRLAAFAPLVRAELELRKAQASDFLRTVKWKVSMQAMLYRSNKDSWGQAAKTRFGKKLQTGSAKVRRLQARYNACRDVMLSIGLASDDANFLPLTPNDINPVVVHHEREQPGSKNETLPWIWKAGAYRAERTQHTDTAWEQEMDRVLWFRASAKAARWGEEVRLLREEIKRTQRFFRFFEDWWHERTSMSDDEEVSLANGGRIAFAAKQEEMYGGLLNNVRLACEKLGYTDLLI